MSFEDRRLTCEPVAFTLAVALRDYQRDAAGALVRHQQGCLICPPGGGKTVMALAAVAAARQPALVIVHTRDLVTQWQQRVIRDLRVEPGTIAEGEVHFGDVTVATIQTLSQLDKATFADVAASFGCVVVDECHHVSSPTHRRVLGGIPAKYRFGITATPDREDGLGQFLELMIGPIVHRIEPRALVAAGYLVVPRVEVLRTECNPVTDEYFTLVTELTRDPERNALIVEVARREAEAKHAVLVLTGRVDHAEALAHGCLTAGAPAAALTSETPKAWRTSTLERFRRGALPIVCATTLADEGLDITRLSRLLLATPAKAQGRTMQRLGRLMRPHEGKGQPVLFDIVDEHPITLRQYRDRVRAYRRILGVEAGELSV